METVLQILRECRAQEVQLNAKGGDLEVVFDEAPSEALVTLLRSHKADVLAFLNQAASSKQKGASLVKLEMSVAPLSPGQQRLWFMDQLESGSAHYNIIKALKLSGKLDREFLQASLEAIIRRHEILRTVYFESDVVQQQVKEYQGLDYSETDISDIGNQQQILEELINKEQTKSFDLSKDSVIRALLISLNAEQSVLVLTIHHIACDGWSLNIVVNELIQSYQQLADGRPISLPSLPFQYNDVALWQQKNVNDWKASSDFWLNYLQDAPKLHELPTDYSRPDELSFKGGSIETAIDSELNKSVLAICSELSITPFVFYYSVFALILSRWSGQRDVVIGTPVANRERLGVESLVGYFSNTMVLRSRVDPAQNFNSFLAASKSNFLDVFANQHVPFELIVDALELPRSLSHSPIFQIFFSYHSQSESRQKLSLPGLELETLSLASVLTKFDLELSITDADSIPKLNWIYSTDLFDKSTICRLADSYRHAIRAIVNDVSATLGSIDILPSVDRDVLNQINEHTAAQRQVADLSLGISRFVQGDKTALICEQSALSYTELDQLANQIAHWLLTVSVTPGAVVGVKLARSVEMIAVLLGILRVGAAYLPLEPGYPKQRLAYMTAQCAPKIVIDSIDDLYQSIRHQPTTLPENLQIDQNSLAYVIFTSGSTGQPKGVSISRKNMSAFLDSFRQRYPLEPGIWLAVTGISFDISVLEIFGALSFGHTIIINPDGTSEDKTALNIPALVQQHQVTELQCTPSYAVMHLLNAGKEELSSLKNLFLGGEALPAGLVNDLRRLTSASIHNMYGPTEATVWSTSETVDIADSDPPIGKPLPGYKCFVLDENKKFVPAGTPAELFISGEALSVGYINNPSETSKRFIDGAFVNQDRLYATGDIVTWTLDGNLKYKGRKDTQVKLRGYRIELSEVEHCINSHESVKSSVVAIAGEKDSAILVAYIQMHNGTKNHQDTERDIKGLLADSLPHHMIPSQMMFLEALPQTLNGKIDRKALPAFKPAVSGFTRVEGKLERTLAEIWSELLALPAEQIFQESNFFSLGGHSLLITKLVNELRERFHSEVSVRDVFRNPVLKQLAERIKELQDADESSGLELII